MKKGRLVPLAAAAFRPSVVGKDAAEYVCKASASAGLGVCGRP